MLAVPVEAGLNRHLLERAFGALIDAPDSRQNDRTRKNVIKMLHLLLCDETQFGNAIIVGN